MEIWHGCWKKSVLTILGALFFSVIAGGAAWAEATHKHKGWEQWHPQFGGNHLGKAGTQCYFCEEGQIDRDSDGDGVLDSRDQCPGTPPGVAVDAVGCPLDSDQDGVPDHLDRCPGTPIGVPVDDRGCPMDRDGDGVMDYQDQCPDTPRGAAVNAVGCWVVENLRFETGKWDILSQYHGVLNAIVAVLMENPGLRVEIQGHTDNRGKEAYNQMLSENRATAVMGYLTGHGVSADRLSARGYGFHHPIADNDTDMGRAMNRRVELKPIR